MVSRYSIHSACQSTMSIDQSVLVILVKLVMLVKSSMRKVVSVVVVRVAASTTFAGVVDAVDLVVNVVVVLVVVVLVVLVSAMSAIIIRFGNAGVHLYHGCSYPIAGMIHDRGYYPDAYESAGKNLVPHGL